MTENAGKELQKKRKLVDKNCIDCDVLMKEVYENKQRCQCCKWKHNSKQYYLRKKGRDE